MAEEPLKAGHRYALKHTSRTVRATVQAVHERTDPETLEPEADPARLELNDIGRVTLRTPTPVLADPYSENRVTGAFILIDEHSNDTVAAGLVTEAREVEQEAEARRDVTWHPSALDRAERWKATGQRGATVWLTGLPASGKSTIAVALERALVDSGRTAYLLDGDNIRHGLSDDLGFVPRRPRREHPPRGPGRAAVRRRRRGGRGVAGLAAGRRPRSGPQAARGGRADMLEIYVNTSAEECARRDPKGLYAKAEAGEIKDFTGVNAPYEAPEDPALRIDTAEDDVDGAVARIVELLDDVSP